MITLTIILGYLLVMALLVWIIEPCLRLRFGWYFIKPDPSFIHVGDPSREIFGALIVVFWPVGIPLFFIIKYGLIYFILSICRGIKFLNRASEEFWEPKPKVKFEYVVDESKTNYRNFALVKENEK